MPIAKAPAMMHKAVASLILRALHVDVREAEDERKNGHCYDSGVEDGFHDYFSFPMLMITPEASPFAAAL